MLLIRGGQNPQVITDSIVFQADDRIIALAPLGEEKGLRHLLIGGDESDKT